MSDVQEENGQNPELEEGSDAPKNTGAPQDPEAPQGPETPEAEPAAQNSQNPEAPEDPQDPEEEPDPENPQPPETPEEEPDPEDRKGPEGAGKSKSPEPKRKSPASTVEVDMIEACMLAGKKLWEALSSLITGSQKDPHGHPIEPMSEERLDRLHHKLDNITDGQQNLAEGLKENGQHFKAYVVEARKNIFESIKDHTEPGSEKRLNMEKQVVSINPNDLIESIKFEAEQKMQTLDPEDREKAMADMAAFMEKPSKFLGLDSEILEKNMDPTDKIDRDLVKSINSVTEALPEKVRQQNITQAQENNLEATVDTPDLAVDGDMEAAPDFDSPDSASNIFGNDKEPKKNQQQQPSGPSGP